jgi:hypothetical protein
MKDSNRLLLRGKLTRKKVSKGTIVSNHTASIKLKCITDTDRERLRIPSYTYLLP